VDAEVRLGASQAGERSFERLVRLQPALRIEDGTEASLQVPYVLPGVVLTELIGDALNALRVLHERKREVKALEVVLEVPGVVHDHVVVELRRIIRRELHGPLGGELDHRRGAQAPVQVHVQLRLRESEQPAGSCHGWGGPCSDTNPFSTSTSGVG